nr:hypothetical protein PHANIE_0050 [Acinetobacter phage Phanie]
MKWDIETIIKLINGVGFPIVVCIALFWSQQTQQMQQTAVLTEFKSTIQNNTEALNRISYQLQKEGLNDRS